MPPKRPGIITQFHLQDRVRLLSNNTFGFGDLPEDGDVDYNDIVLQVNLA
ncbi:DUF4114 domain-containing protein [Scytonema sp. NUACC26]